MSINIQSYATKISFISFFSFESSLILLHQYQDCSLCLQKNKTVAEGDRKENNKNKLICSKESHLHPNIPILLPAKTHQQMKGEQNNFCRSRKQ